MGGKKAGGGGRGICMGPLNKVGQPTLNMRGLMKGGSRGV